jgi:hypothetical protein
VTDEHRKALSDLRRAQSENQRVKAEVESASQVLHERDGYTSALAGFLDGDADGLIEENRLKAELVQLERDIRVAEQEVKRKLALHNPGVAGSLVKERAYYQIEIERELKALENTDEEIESHKLRLAEIFSGPRYRLASELEFQYRKLVQKRRFLRSLLTRTKNQFDSMTPHIPSRSNESKTERTAMGARVEPRLALMQANERYDRRPQKYSNYINFLVDQIEDLNVRLQETGLEDDVVETEELRERALAAIARSPEPEPEAEAEVEHEEDAVPEPEPKRKQIRVKKRRRVPKSPPPAKEEEQQRAVSQEGVREPEQTEEETRETVSEHQEKEQPAHEITDGKAEVVDVRNVAPATEEEEEEEAHEPDLGQVLHAAVTANEPDAGLRAAESEGQEKAEAAEPMGVFGNALLDALTDEKTEGEQQEGSGSDTVFAEVQTLVGVKPDTRSASGAAAQPASKREPPLYEDVEFVSGGDEDESDRPEIRLEETGTSVRPVPSAENEGAP